MDPSRNVEIQPIRHNVRLNLYASLIRVWFEQISFSSLFQAFLKLTSHFERKSSHVYIIRKIDKLHPIQLDIVVTDKKTSDYC